MQEFLGAIFEFGQINLFRKYEIYLIDKSPAHYKCSHVSNHAKAKACVIFQYNLVFLFCKKKKKIPTSSLIYLASCSFRLRTAPAFVLYFQSLSKLQIYLYVKQFPSWKIYLVCYPDGDPWWLQAFKFTPVRSNLTRMILQWTSCEARASTRGNITAKINATWIKCTDC